MVVADRSEERIILTSEYRDKERVKLLPGAKWDTKAQTWWLKLTWASCVQLRGVFGDDLTVAPGLAAWSRNEVTTRVNPCMALRAADDADLGPGYEDLYPFQRAGVKFMATAGQSLNADEMGLGKTVEGILTLELLGDKSYPTLVVCPNSKKFDWEAEYGQAGELVGGFARWAPKRRVVVINGGVVARRKQIAQLENGEADVGIINWESLRAHTRLAPYGSVQLTDKDKEPKELNEIKFATVIGDECHRAKDPRAKQTRALWYVGDRAPYRIGLTGTPVANAPEDAWAQLRFVSPTEFPSKSKFIERYGLQSWNMFGGMSVVGLKSETRDELFKIMDARMIRRLKKTVQPQLPDKIPTTRTCELGAKQRKAYDQLRKEMLAELEDGILLATNPLQRATRLVQFASAYGQMVDDKLLLTDPSCKVDALEELVPELGDQRAVVFAESRQLIELAHARMVKNKIPCGLFTGAVSVTEREENKRAFLANKTKLLLVTLGAGGEGLSLSGVSIAIFLQRSWSSVKNNQAEDRLHGIGRGIEGVATEIIDLVSVDTIEQRVHAVRAKKGMMLEEVVRDADTLKAWLAK